MAISRGSVEVSVIQASWAFSSWKKIASGVPIVDNRWISCELSLWVGWASVPPLKAFTWGTHSEAT